MRKIFSSVLVMSAVTSFAQSDEQLPAARILALDTTAAVANAFNYEVMKQAGGFNLAFVDTSAPRTVVCLYKTSSNESMKIEYKYTYKESDQDQNLPPRQQVNYQRITATDATMARIFSFIFNAKVHEQIV